MEQETRRTTLGRRNPALAAIVQPAARDLYWATGIWEGEGSCGRAVARPSGAGSEWVSVSQKDTWILLRLRHLFGGSVRPYKKQTRQVLHRWLISGARARGFLMSVYGMVSPRRQAEVQGVMQWTKLQS